MPKETFFTERLAKIVEDQSSKLGTEFLIEKGIVKQTVLCDKCEVSDLQLVESSVLKERFGYKCQDRFCPAWRKPQCIRKFSFLKNFPKIPTRIIVLLIHEWARKVHANECTRSTGLSLPTVLKFYQVAVL